MDLVRVATFTMVIFVHCLTSSTFDAPDSLPISSMALLMHFTRNAFFALTGFVLMYQYFDNHDFGTLAFWRRRLKLVIFPYIAWSAIYWLVEGMWAFGRLHEVPTSLDEFWDRLSWGTSGFQMYFLFVMMQVYILFPLVLWLVRATVGRHALLLAVSLTLQVGMTMFLTHGTPPDFLAEHWWHHYATFVPYQFAILYGAVVAVHREAINDWIRGKGWWLTAGLIVTGAFAVISLYLRVEVNGMRPMDARGAFEPTLLPFIIMAIACMYAAALYWAENLRREGTGPTRFIAYASNRSFGVFLVHVLVLYFVLWPKPRGRAPWIIETFGTPVGVTIVFVLTLAGSLLLVELLRRLPGSLYLTGRPRLPITLPTGGRRAERRS